MSRTYFTDDGSFGSADDLAIIDTSLWSDADWDYIANVPDHDRLNAAQDLNVILYAEADLNTEGTK